MSSSADQSPLNFSEMLEALYRAESGRILATLIGLLGNFELAEDALQEAFAAAARQPKPIGPGSSRFTICSCASRLRPWSSLTAPWPWRCETGLRQGWRS